MTTICLVRHGETDWNASGRLQGITDIPLNQTGIGQAEQCSVYLQQKTWDLILTSPLKRARQTADIINNNLNIPLVEINDFSERDFGDAEGMTIKEIVSTFPDRNYPNREEGHVFLARIMKGLDKVKREYPSQNILLVTHGAVINSIFDTFSNGEFGRERLKLKNASLNTIYFQDEGWKIKEFNHIAHLSTDRS